MAQRSDIVYEFGRILEVERTRRGWSLSYAASVADLPPVHLLDVEQGYPEPGGGRRLGPRLLKLERIANVYGLSVKLEIGPRRRWLAADHAGPAGFV